MAWKVAKNYPPPPKNKYQFIPRDWDRTESDDFQLNIQPKLNNSLKSLEIRDENGELFGWRIQGERRVKNKKK